MRPFFRLLLVIAVAFSFDAVAMSVSPVPPALAQCSAPGPGTPDEPCCDNVPQSGCAGLGQPIESNGNDGTDTLWTQGLAIVLGAALVGTWWARRNRAAGDQS